MILSCPNRAPLVLDLAGLGPVEPVLIPDIPGGALRLERPAAVAEDPLAFRVASLDGTLLPAALSHRSWRGELTRHSLPTGRYRVTAEGSTGDLATAEVEVLTGETSRVSW